MKQKRIGIAADFYREDSRLKDKVEVPCSYIDGKGMKRAQIVKVTEAEKFLIESIAMRLFLDRKRIIKREKLDGGIVRMTAVVTLD